MLHLWTIRLCYRKFLNNDLLCNSFIFIFYVYKCMWFVNLDADAIILDFTLQLEELVSLYPDAHLIASADIRMGLINTGVLVLRNTAWMRRFLAEWWDGPTVVGPNINNNNMNTGLGANKGHGQKWRASQCDQDAFDQLYSHYARINTNTNTNTNAGAGKGKMRHNKIKTDEDKDKDEVVISTRVKVLSMDALNSHPPATLHQQPHSPVLHLMGESAEMRRRVFQQAWHLGVCASVKTQADAVVSNAKLFRPQQQLGISRRALQAIARWSELIHASFIYPSIILMKYSFVAVMRVIDCTPPCL